jgi:hypothetical protein
LPDLIQILLRQASTSGSRSTALNPLAWLFGLTLSGLIIGAIEHVTSWILILLGIASTFAFLAYLVAYFYLLSKDRDALRSERFTLSKIAMDKSIRGDSLTGFIDTQKRPELSERDVEVDEDIT